MAGAWVNTAEATPGQWPGLSAALYQIGGDAFEDDLVALIEEFAAVDAATPFRVLARQALVGTGRAPPQSGARADCARETDVVPGATADPCMSAATW